LESKTNLQWFANTCYRPRKSLLPLQSKEPVSSRKCGKIISQECEWTFCYQFFAARGPWIWKTHTFWLKPLKPVLQFHLDLKIKNQLNIK
jgi:hypothetical protein